MKKSLLSIFALTVIALTSNSQDLSRNEQVAVVKVTNFLGNLNANKISLNWTVAENEMINQFVVERSTDGTDFHSVALVFGSERNGSENYQFAQPMNTDVIYYRLRLTDISGNVTYSKILVFKISTTHDMQMKVLNNPVSDKLTLSFETAVAGAVTITLTDITGRQVMTKKLNNLKGSNLVNFPLPVLNNGMYVVDLFDGTSHNAAKFIK